LYAREQFMPAAGPLRGLSALVRSCALSLLQSLDEHGELLGDGLRVHIAVDLSEAMTEF
jgi:hypothetical protein